MRTLIGRDDEMTRVRRLLDEQSALLVRGPRGCGVSAVLEAAVKLAAARGLPVLRAAGVEAESGFPYAALHQLLRPLRREVRELPGAPGEALRASFGLSEAGTPDPSSVAAALVALAGAAGNGFVCVDEWQWVDAESRAAISAFIACDVGVPVLLGGHVGGPAGVEELRLRPLDPVAASAVLGESLPLLVRERILREAEGRPLALRELPAAYAGAGDGELLGSWAPLTPVLEDAFADGLERLEPDCAQAVLVAALDDAGRVPDIVAAASRLSGRELSAAVFDPAVALGFVALDGDVVAFTHPLTRAAVRRASSPAARAAGHEAFAFAVAATDPDRATWHRVVGAPGLDASLAAELEAVSWRSRDAGDYERAAAGLRRAAHLTPAGRERTRRLVAAAEHAYEIGGIEVGDRLLEEVVPEHLDDTGRARLLLLRPQIEPEALAAAARATADADLALRLRWRAATKLTVLGGDGSGIARESLVMGDQLAAVVSVGADGRPDELPRVVAADPVALALRGYLAHVTGDDRLAAALLDQAVHELRAQRRRTRLAQVLALSACVQLGISALDRAQADGEEAVRLCRELRQPVWVALARTALATVAALRGDDEEAERRAAEAERMALRLPSAYVLALVQGARGALALAGGRPAEAFAQLRRLVDPTDPAYDPGTAATLLGDLAEAATTAEEHDTVRSLLTSLPDEPRSALARMHAALVLADDDDADVAFAMATPASPAANGGGMLMRAVSANSGGRFVRAGRVAPAPARLVIPGAVVDVPFVHARMLLVHGMRLRRRRRVFDSREPLRTAAAIFAQLGVTPWAERAQRELAATAETAHRSEEELDQLTPQELEIARMAARGMTNRAIAADLALSPRTVGHHLTKIFPKLDVASRAGIGAALERLGY
jgi:DNA-binding CsgD family transcriptional regulator